MPEFKRSKSCLVFCAISIFLSSNLILAQETIKPEISKFNIHGDLGTWIVINSVNLNIEGLITASDSRKIQLYGRVGYGYIHILDAFNDEDQLRGPLFTLTMLTGKGNHHFELNGGTLFGSYFGEQTDEEGNRTIPILALGYRFQKPEGGFLFRATAGIMGMGIGLGYAF